MFFSSFIFKESHVLIEQDNLSEKIVKAKLDDIDKYEIGDLEDLLVLINEECGNPEVVVDGGDMAYVN